ncbi:MAG: hypothetical protein CME32_27495 [Gimesia sp.]|nr:hypothetical protein [Gimesia sp.]
MKRFLVKCFPANVRSLIWLQAFFAAVMCLQIRFGNIRSYPNLLNSFLFTVLSLYSLWGFPVAFIFLFNKHDRSTLQHFLVLIAGVLIYFASVQILMVAFTRYGP